VVERAANSGLRPIPMAVSAWLQAQWAWVPVRGLKDILDKWETLARAKGIYGVIFDGSVVD
jgi:hypothetical protein